MHIKGKFVTLRAPEPRDAPLLNEWSNDPALWHWLGGWHFPYSMRSTETWIDDRGKSDLGHQVWCIDAPDVGLLGTATLDQIDWKNRSAIHALMIGGTGARGKGYALDAAQAVLRYAFDELGLNRIEGHVLTYNDRSIGLYEGKIGFQREGIRREAYFKGGRFQDAIVYGMTAADYRRLQATQPYWDAPGR